MADYYVYLWRDPQDNVPRYIGKGKENRVWEHIEKPSSTYYSRLLSKRYRSNFVCLPQVIWVNTEEEAYELETLLIQTIGRKDLGLGPLLNKTDGGGSLNPSTETRALMAEKASISSTISWTIPEIREKRTASLKIAAARKEVQDKKSESLKRTLSTPEAKLKRSQEVRKMLAQPEVNERRVESIRTAHAREDLRAERSATMNLRVSCIACHRESSLAGLNAHKCRSI